MAVWSVVDYERLQLSSRWDPEAFTPALLQLDEAFAAQPRLHHLAKVTHPAEIPRIYVEGEDCKPFLLAKNIRPFLAEVDSAPRVPPETFNFIPQNRLLMNDVLVTRSGANSGMACVYLGADGAAYTSGEGLIVRSHGGIDGAYLSVFLNTESGVMLCRRAMYGSGQPHILPKYLELTPVPRLGSVESEAAALVREAFDMIHKAGSCYPEAEAELLERMGWGELASMPLELCYSADFGELEKAGRSDPEFFHPHYDRLRAQIEKRGSMKLGDICEPIMRGVQPEFDSDGEVLALDSKSVRPQGVEPAEGERVSREFYDRRTTAAARVQYDDVLLNSTGRGTLGRAACYRRTELAVCDNHIAILRPDKNTCLPLYLALFLNSPAGLAQSEQFQSGSSGQLELYPQHVEQFQVFVPRNRDGSADLAWQNSLADKVSEAGLAKGRARETLEVAKRLVEDAVGL